MLAVKRKPGLSRTRDRRSRSDGARSSSPSGASPARFAARTERPSARWKSINDMMLPVTRLEHFPAKCEAVRQPKSGLPDFGHSSKRPKSETSDFGWKCDQLMNLDRDAGKRHGR